MSPSRIIDVIGRLASGAGSLRAADRGSRRVDELVLRDSLKLAYAQTPLALCASMLVALLMISALSLHGWHTGHLTWLALFCVLTLTRIHDQLRYPRRRRRAGHDDSRERIRLSVWVVTNAMAWAAFPVLFIGDLDQSARATVMMFLSAIVCAGVSTLSSMGVLGIVYAGIVLLPMSLTLLIDGGNQGLVHGTLAGALFVVLVAGHRSVHRATLATLRLARQNEDLMNQAVQSRRRAESLNRRLSDARRALTHSNRTLEQRVRARTLALEREIGEHSQLARRLTELAACDPMTGLANRARLEQRLSGLLLEAGRHEAGVAVLFIDLDRFKEVNDALGHLAGDEVLRTIARRFEAVLPVGGLVARWGGDEFVAALPIGHDPEQALHHARRLRTAAAEPISVIDQTVRLAASVGIALYPQDASDGETLVRSADMAVYAAKVSGRASVRRFEDSMYASLRERHKLRQALRDAIDNDRLQLAFQPVVCARTGRTLSFEALTRWRDAERGWVSPAEFIPVAEESGSIVALGRWVLDNACRAAASWPSPEPGVPGPSVAVNVSAAQILAGDFVPDLQEALRRSGLPPQRLQLELTESFFAQDPDRLMGLLGSVRRLGVRVAIDDFGAGYSSLALLRRLPVDILKIDRSFIEDATPASATFLEAIQAIARSLGLQVTAEGVETEAQRTMLRALGIDLLQGYLIARPMPDHEARRWQLRQGAAALAEPA